MIQRYSGVARVACALLGCLLAAERATAVLVAYDPFLTGSDRAAGEYDLGVDLRTMGAAAVGWVGTQGIDGFGVAHAGTTANFQANELTENAAAVDYEQGGRMQWLGVGDFPSDRNLTRQLNPTPESSEWWMSIMVNRLNWAGVPSANTYAVGGFTDAGGNGLQVGFDDEAGDGVPDLILLSNGVKTTLTTDTDSSANQFLILRLEINESGAETISVWNDPDSVVALGDPDVSVTDQDLFSTLDPFTQSKYESPGQSGVVYFDEIRLGTTRGAVAPLPTLIGDYNGDDIVDAADYTVWRDNLGGAGEVLLNRSPEVEGVVSIDDYAVWVDNYGDSLLPPAAVAVVPEPTAAVLALWAALGAVGAIRRR